MELARNHRLKVVEDELLYVLLGLRDEDEAAEKAREEAATNANVAGKGKAHVFYAGAHIPIDDTDGVAIPVDDDVPGERMVYDSNKPCMSVGTVYPNMEVFRWRAKVMNRSPGSVIEIDTKEVEGNPEVELPFVVGAPLAKRNPRRYRKLRIKGCLEGGGSSKPTSGSGDNGKEKEKKATKEYHQSEASCQQKPNRESIIQDNPIQVTRSRLSMLMGEGPSPQLAVREGPSSQSAMGDGSSSQPTMRVAPKKKIARKLTPKKMTTN
ncbi:hypothetical protein E2562_017339 [Oryza meyeriana var. granulata]|uniref:Uncharacterized protein n=1 Tax=Oryza meyeriana var. granulata TaxID=110450 RepID=A0A6G1BXA7_9ORYZ|nr:hypothetical protein E2562_017339 [Oryza meyeriana var. granulata]